MSEHLQDDTLPRQFVGILKFEAGRGHAKRANAQYTVGHVVERRKRQQLFEIGLSQRKEGSPKNRQQRETKQHVGVLR